MDLPSIKIFCLICGQYIPDSKDWTIKYGRTGLCKCRLCMLKESSKLAYKQHLVKLKPDQLILF